MLLADANVSDAHELCKHFLDDAQTMRRRYSPKRRTLSSEIHRLTVPRASGGNFSEPATAPQLV